MTNPVAFSTDDFPILWFALANFLLRLALGFLSLGLLCLFFIEEFTHHVRGREFVAISANVDYVSRICDEIEVKSMISWI